MSTYTITKQIPSAGTITVKNNTENRSETLSGTQNHGLMYVNTAFTILYLFLLVFFTDVYLISRYKSVMTMTDYIIINVYIAICLKFSILNLLKKEKKIMKNLNNLQIISIVSLLYYIYYDNIFYFKVLSLLIFCINLLIQSISIDQVNLSTSITIIYFLPLVSNNRVDSNLLTLEILLNCVTLSLNFSNSKLVVKNFVINSTNLLHLLVIIRSFTKIHN
ncbi:hypothetical protein KAFR_0C01460 [Kazachstania africana CBS 2517]|uniref:Uncharacterized protein n=1 Tax=Kazachstania africana (strain ATCC 22294 / BCRC 22015 / CBS 2517 / CECT 1963 / NBRC 1671 / NRRL Y-8276) TaxID=1071382 RepID=H2ARY9_KAZAF|nr:hypothetical protein KAFR_0C01460 [Kazachstania africana CBS 2517]CCF57139.1 hypothetical protein KAFR_0C01460 [Kazachstania africana CBS 2517]